jgi:hypothetical protein
VSNLLSPDGEEVFMRDNERFEITIYHNGVHFIAPTPGKKRYLQEKAFLNELTGVKYPPQSLPRPIPDPSQDFYMLSDEQLEAYSAFRKKLERNEP